jgi:hypothetical protein
MQLIQHKTDLLPEVLLNNLSPEQKRLFQEQFNKLSQELQNFSYNKFISSSPDIQVYDINRLLSLNPKQLAESIEREQARKIKQEQIWVPKTPTIHCCGVVKF